MKLLLEGSLSARNGIHTSRRKAIESAMYGEVIRDTVKCDFPLSSALVYLSELFDE